MWTNNRTCVIICAILKITLVTPWKKARKLIKKDPRYELYGEDDKVTFCTINVLLRVTDLYKQRILIEIKFDSNKSP